MRFTGKIHTWNEERGFGFIRPTDGGQDIFVHVSSLPYGRADRDMLLSFEVTLNRDGKKKAINVCPAVAAAAPDAARPSWHVRPTGREYPVRRRRSRPGRGRWRAAVLVGLLAAVGWSGYRHWPAWAPLVNHAPEVPAAPSTSPATTYRCDGRQVCSQMTSCEEATWFLRNCPGTRMDGNHDGVPCEMQWCR
ncbi:MAG: cold shock domain-containing protein [Ramlibacter sp.]